MVPQEASIQSVPANWNNRSSKSSEKKMRSSQGMSAKSFSASPLDSPPLQKIIRLIRQELSQGVIPGGFQHTAGEETENVSCNRLSRNTSEKQSTVSGG